MANVARIPDGKDKIMVTLAPAWLETMLITQFFTPCDHHPDMPRNERNLFCTDCSECSLAFCIYCRSNHHANHRIVQIRRSSYHEVVRVVEVEGLIDVKGVHTYIINSAKVFFLNERPQPKGIGAAAGKAAASPYFCELSRIKSNGDATFLLDEYKQSNSNNRVEGANGRSLNDVGVEDGTSVRKDVKGGSLRPANRSRKGIPHRSPFF
ncbi:PLATZ transcription factor family protein [Rhynchospora pubera]|uniref:PLATZ transcription factor family protein n=1 Tax=Rhynchospora pubera TaxID=906938 RepID=A0AAV8FGS0_9POAL|nr:PLATZ transcription factor family protein [Rhynchospora pubera]